MIATKTDMQNRGLGKALTEAAIADLPELMQRYLRYTGAMGTRIPARVRLIQRGEINISGKKWIPIVAKQEFDTRRSEFVWKAKARMVHVVDQFVFNEGLLTIRLFNRIKVQEAKGPEIDQSEAQRYLTECIWFPWAFISERICWETLDAGSVRAHFEFGRSYASADFHIDKEGILHKITARRYALEKNGMVLGDWEIHDLKYKEFHGLRIPYRSKVGWWKDGKLNDYYRFEITEIEYE